MIEIYLCTRRGVLHRAVMVDGERLVSESCNLDQAIGVQMYQDLDVARSVAKRLCRRCFKETS